MTTPEPQGFTNAGMTPPPVDPAAYGQPPVDPGAYAQPPVDPAAYAQPPVDPAAYAQPPAAPYAQPPAAPYQPPVDPAAYAQPPAAPYAQPQAPYVQPAATGPVKKKQGMKVLLVGLAFILITIILVFASGKIYIWPAIVGLIGAGSGILMIVRKQ